MVSDSSWPGSCAAQILSGLCDLDAAALAKRLATRYAHPYGGYANREPGLVCAICGAYQTKAIEVFRAAGWHELRWINTIHPHTGESLMFFQMFGATASLLLRGVHDEDITLPNGGSCKPPEPPTKPAPVEVAL